MIVTNKITGEDVSDLYLRQMKGEINRDEFIKLAGLNPKVEAEHYKKITQ